MKKVELEVVKKIYKDFSVFETEDGFGVVMAGRYQPGITFLIPKVWEEAIDGKAINPLAWTPGDYEESALVRKITSNMNIGFNANRIQVIFGDFWTSRKGSPCFRPKSVKVAKHVLVRAGWGGPFNKTGGVGRSFEWRLGDRDQSNLREATKRLGILYFRKASSGGGGQGCDYWVLPVGFKNGNLDINAQEERANEIRRMFLEEAEKKESEIQASRAAMSTLGKRVEAVNERFARLGLNGYFIGDGYYSEYKGGDPVLLTEESVADLENHVAYNEKRRKERLNQEAIRNALNEVLDQAEARLSPIGATLYRDTRRDKWGCTISASNVFPREYRADRTFSFSVTEIEEVEGVKEMILEVIKRIEEVASR